MKTNCLMCGREISQGIVCEKCDRPKRAKSSSGGSAATALNLEPEAAPVPLETPVVVDPFPKAPIVPFPLESTSVALTNMYEVLATSGAAAVLLDAEHHVKFVSPQAQQALQLPSADGVTIKQLEMALGFAIPESGQIFNLNIMLNNAKTSVAVIPLSGGNGGYVLLLKVDERDRESAFMTFVREAVMTPLESLQAALAAAVLRKKDPLLQDAVNTIDQILSSLELAPTEQPQHQPPPRPTRAPKAQPKAAGVRIADVLEKLIETHGDLAAIKGVKLQLDLPATDETFHNVDQLSAAMGILVDNAVHYVADGGQVVLGLRFLEHKGKPLLLFFVMDNGPVVPEEMRERIFDADFVPDEMDDLRTGKSLAHVREFAVAHGGQIWVESKSGKACTFFVRIRPDSER